MRIEPPGQGATSSADPMAARSIGPPAASAPRGSALEVLAVATRLGLTSFGGPVAHLGYFRAEYVARRRWLDDATYADLVALCQFLPGARRAARSASASASCAPGCSAG